MTRTLPPELAAGARAEDLAPASSLQRDQVAEASVELAGARAEDLAPSAWSEGLELPDVVLSLLHERAYLPRLACERAFAAQRQAEAVSLDPWAAVVEACGYALEQAESWDALDRVRRGEALDGVLRDFWDRIAALRAAQSTRQLVADRDQAGRELLRAGPLAPEQLAALRGWMLERRGGVA